jgi:hypothetical protein
MEEIYFDKLNNIESLLTSIISYENDITNKINKKVYNNIYKSNYPYKLEYPYKIEYKLQKIILKLEKIKKDLVYINNNV